MERSMQVRYSRVKNQPKNTLVTKRDGETIFFGIARCRLKADHATKEEGRKLAEFRANIAVEASGAGQFNRDGTFVVHSTGMFGCVGVADILKLLKYFDNLERIKAREEGKK
jgi:hypothetical protein